MGVMECNRNGCRNIMCERLFDNRRYICEECWRELLEHRKSWPASMQRSDVKGIIERFLETDVGTHSPPLTADEVDAEFKRLVE